ncbi:hypothetical protein [Mycobacteroides abscessus]|uniref:hypothetical protein n=1 Tax=Mycobacteroides abscessus TaxID=36809 RepID=UPI0011C45155|nr:hypothetical protein [Mycobacteroides abscessus]
MAKFGYGCISPFCLGTATPLAILASPVAVSALAAKDVTKPEVHLAMWALVMCCGLLIPLMSDMLALRARRKRQDNSEHGNTAWMIVAGTCVFAIVTWRSVVAGLPETVHNGAPTIAFKMATYVGVFAAASIPTLFTRSYRVNERSIALGVGLGIILALSTT